MSISASHEPMKSQHISASHECTEQQFSITTPTRLGSWWYKSFLSLLLVALIGECLWPFYPLLAENQPDIISAMMVLFAVSIAINQMTWSMWIKGILYTVSLLLYITIIFHTHPTSPTILLEEIVSVLTNDLHAIGQAKFDDIKMETRMLLFLCGCMLLISAVQSIVLHKHYGSWFILAIITYLVCLQIFIRIDTIDGIIRTIGIGLILQATLVYTRVRLTYPTSNVQARPPYSWWLSSFTMAGLICGAGWLWLCGSGHDAKLMQSLSVANPPFFAWMWSWQDRFFASDKAKQYSRSGYSEDDSVVGGPLILDDQILFLAKSTDFSYWRGESKSLYTGKGWKNHEEQVTAHIHGTAENAKISKHEIRVHPDFLHYQIYFPGKLIRVEAIINDKGRSISPKYMQIDAYSGKVTLPKNSGRIKSYLITTQAVEQPWKHNKPDSNDLHELKSVLKYNLQLPNELPVQIRELSKKITNASKHPITKAKAVEQYLRNQYTYSLVKPTLPKKGVDIVSHFLFTDRIGYCSHFSTAMVVMLRTLGIPARWVKGFVPSANAMTQDSEESFITFRARNAHSWVEAYFPQFGWIPFEPTPGYSIANQQPRDIAEYETALDAFTSLASIDQEHRSILEKLWSAYIGGSSIIRSLHISFIIIMICGAGFISWMTVKNKGVRSWIQQSLNNKKDIPISRYDPSRCASTEKMKPIWTYLYHTYGQRLPHQSYRAYIASLPVDDEYLKNLLDQFLCMNERALYEKQSKMIYSRCTIHRLHKELKARIG